MTDPIYEYINEDGSEQSGSSSSIQKHPKWATPATPFQVRFLAIFRRKYYPDKDTAHAVRMIEKTMSPMNPNKPPILPAEWVEEKIEYVIKQRASPSGTPYQLKGLISMINNTGLCQQWIDQRKSQQKAMDLPSTRIYTSSVPTIGTPKKEEHARTKGTMEVPDWA